MEVAAEVVSMIKNVVMWWKRVLASLGSFKRSAPHTSRKMWQQGFADALAAATTPAARR
jgi:hypothetical protein